MVLARSWPDEHYGNEDDYLDALISALRVEYNAIVDAGFILQLDCTDIPMVASMPGIDARSAVEFIDRAVGAVNAATDGLPADRLRMHLCWGNWEGPHRYDVPLESVLPHVWSARPDAISFEAANPRHAHEWRVFETIHVPDNKVLMPGVIDTKNNVVEHPELVAQRIEHFAALVGRENVMPGSDCGFGTFAGFGAVFPPIAWMKLEALGRGAKLASARLWDSST
jgi:5-methyltetrahydropteroyltriglutamate--homocysteine methyltransferase